MEEVVGLLKQIAPEIANLVENRYTILRSIYFNQPIGRRALSSIISWSERQLRAEVKRLEEQGLLTIDQQGMKLTDAGKDMIFKMEHFIYHLRGLNPIAQKIRQRFNCGYVSIVPGNTDEDETIKLQLGKEAARYIKKTINDGDIVAVTGGTTMAQIPKAMDKITGLKDVIVVPGRGGLGERVEIESNTIAAELAKKLNAQYRLLYVPDNLSPEAMESIVNEPGIREILNIVRRTNILLHGIGGAEEIGRRRGLSKQEIMEIRKKGAVAEAFGYYFNKEGKVVHTTTSVGLSVADLKNIRIVIAIAGGASKAPAIQAFLKYHSPTVFITDEGAARKLLKLEGGE
ncbi:sugar-binding domain-containing protein [Tepidanaerobacter sp. GT38]|uniref:sugar-binding transcriptional regulator n=1 Tax=Tepidanaerobacter sp. GT38 TaxID=2722793 RepID=UPI001F3722AA|nr:sugar-binding domain-containing protein [Tepidanaerobacter sp. GT38]MCG1011287.1 sugar-binding domain-containing protein [Tepidanaerobacter sp. GT38]